jgi:hypothetical protein
MAWLTFDLDDLYSKSLAGHGWRPAQCLTYPPSAEWLGGGRLAPVAGQDDRLMHA